jgi:hypothetical protein
VNSRRMAIILVLVTARAFGEATAETGGRLAGMREPAWFARPVSVRWLDISAAEALADLANQIRQPIWTTDGARARSAGCRVRFEAKRLNGYQAMNALCRMSGLSWTIMEDLIAVTLSEATPASWRASSALLQKRQLREHPDWAPAPVGNAKADLDLVDASPGAAADCLAGVFLTNLFVSRDLRSSQGLVTLRGSGLSAAQAIEEIARQLGVKVVQVDGVFWLGAGDSPRPIPATQGRSPDAGPTRSGIWTVVRSGALTAEGGLDDIQAVQKWVESQGLSPALPKVEPAGGSKR